MPRKPLVHNESNPSPGGMVALVLAVYLLGGLFAVPVRFILETPVYGFHTAGLVFMAFILLVGGITLTSLEPGIRHLCESWVPDSLAYILTLLIGTFILALYLFEITLICGIVL